VKPVEAAIRIWDTSTWKTKSTVQFHKSTVTQLCFSHNDKYLLSVSKARTMALMEIKEDGI
jgi:elongator complex protein 2